MDNGSYRKKSKLWSIATVVEVQGESAKYQEKTVDNWQQPRITFESSSINRWFVSQERGHT